MVKPGSTNGGSRAVKKAPASSTASSCSSSPGVVGAEVTSAAAGAQPWRPYLYRCKYCPRTFRTPQALGGHQNGHRRQREQVKNPPRLPWRPTYWPPLRYLYPVVPSYIAAGYYHYQTRTPSTMAPNIAAGYYHYQPRTPSTTNVATGYLARTHRNIPAAAYPASTLTLFPAPSPAVNQEEAANGVDLTLKL